MKKKLTRESFSTLRSKHAVLSENQQRGIIGGGYFDDYGVGYYDSSGNYYWLRTQDGGSSFTGNFWDSLSNSGSNNGFYYHDSYNGYGSSNNPLSIEDYNRFAKAGIWNGGYVKNFGHIAVYASSVEYGNSIFLDSWYSYGDQKHPVSMEDFYKLVDEGRWKGGYVQGFDYVLPGVTILGSSGIANNSSYFDINRAINHLSGNALNSSSGYCAKYVREALEAGGLSTVGRPSSACDYETYLVTIGFSVVDSANYTPQAGDIIVHEAQAGHKNGHIAMYSGNEWISDFVQNDMYGGSAYRNNPNYTILRWKP